MTATPAGVEVRYVTAADLAATFGITERTAIRRAISGDWPAIRVAGRWRFDAAATSAAITAETAAHRTTTASAQEATR